AAMTGHASQTPRDPWPGGTVPRTAPRKSLKEQGLAPGEAQCQGAAKFGTVAPLAPSLCRLRPGPVALTPTRCMRLPNALKPGLQPDPPGPEIKNNQGDSVLAPTGRRDLRQSCRRRG